LKIQLEESAPSPEIKWLIITSYQKALGLLFDLLERYNWKEMPEMTNSFPFSKTTKWYEAYRKLNELRLTSFNDKQLKLLLQNFLANFRAWENDAFGFHYTSIKPKFPSKKEFLKERVEIETTVAELSNHLSKFDESKGG
jgi:hypothetical protein